MYTILTTVFQITMQLNTALNNIKKLQEDVALKDDLLRAADDEKAQLHEEKKQVETVSEKLKYSLFHFFQNHPFVPLTDSFLC
jgi:septal ring factor EnvC (AmiA/AmiB activator)